MNMLISTAAGLLAAEVFGKRKSRRRRCSNSSSSSASSSSASSNVSHIISPDYKGQRRIQAAPPSLSTRNTQSSSSTLEPSLSSLSSSSDSDSDSTSDSDSESDSDTDTQTSTTPVPRRLTQQNLQTHTNQQQALIPHPSSTSSSSYSSTSTDSSISAPSTLPQKTLLPPPLPPRPPHHQHQHPRLPPPRPHNHHPPPPNPNKNNNDQTAQSLHTRLTTFLPAIRAANASLATSTNPAKYNIEHLNDNEEGKGYIEMDLGLGVLEERGGWDGKGGDGFEALKSPGTLKRERERSRESFRRVVGVRDEEDVLGQLMGKAGGVGEAREAKRRRVVGIEVL